MPSNKACIKAGEEVSALTGDQIKDFQFIARKGALKLEIAGLKRRGRTAYSIIKEAYGYKGSRESVLKQMEQDLVRWN